MKLLQPRDSVSRLNPRSRRTALTVLLLSSIYSSRCLAASPNSSSSSTNSLTNNAFVPKSRHHPRDVLSTASSSSSSTDYSTSSPRRRLDLEDYEESTGTTANTSATRSSSLLDMEHSYRSTSAASRTAGGLSMEDNNRIGVPPVRIGGMVIHDEDIAPPSSSIHRRRSSLRSESNLQNTLSNLHGGSMTQTRSTTPRGDSLSKQPPKRSLKNNRLLQVSLSLVLSTATTSNTLTRLPPPRNTTPLATYLDTGAQVTVMTYAAVQKAGMAHLIDTRYAGHACGVGGVCVKVLGRIPAHTVSFYVEALDEQRGGGLTRRRIDVSPAITVLEDRMEDGVELLLGMDVLEEWQALICLRDRTLTVRTEGLDGGGKKRKRHGGTGGSKGSSQEHHLVIPFVQQQDGTVRRTTRRKEVTAVTSPSLDHRTGSTTTLGSSTTAARSSSQSPSLRSKDSLSSSSLSRPSTITTTSSTNHSKNTKPKRPIANFHSLDDTATSDYSDLESDLDILDKTSNHIEWDDPSSQPSYWDEIKSRSWREEYDEQDYEEEDDEDDIFSEESDQDDLAGCDLSGI